MFSARKFIISLNLNYMQVSYMYENKTYSSEIYDYRKTNSGDKISQQTYPNVF